MAVGKLTQYRSGDKHAERVNGLQPTQHDETLRKRPAFWCHTKWSVSNQQWKHWNQDSKSQEVDKDRSEYCQHGVLTH